MNTRELRNVVEQRKGKRQQLCEEINVVCRRISDKLCSIQHHEQAREIIRHVAQLTQESLSYHISDIASLALEAVYDDPYKLMTEFVQRRNRTECDLYLTRGDMERVEPMNASGGGVVNVLSFALRVASWSMLHPRCRNTILLDEPFANLDAVRIELASKMLEEISKRLKLQMIVVTHSERLMESADKTFQVRLRKGVSQVTEG